MPLAALDGLTLDYTERGSGDPVVFVHGALIADAFRPVVTDQSLTDVGYRLITYRRRGYGASSNSSGLLPLSQHVDDCRRLLAHLGVERAHLVGHSYGGSVALQLALDVPAVVGTLALLEPAMFSRSEAAGYREALERSRQRYREAGAEVAIEEFLKPRYGADFRAWLPVALPGGFEQGVADAATWFEQELGPFTEWSISEDDLRRLTLPVLSIVGGESEALWPRFGVTHRLLLEMLPDVAGVVVPGANHGMQLQKPPDLARALADFWARKPL